MNAFQTPHLRELWVAMGTKYGKTKGAASGISARAWTKRNHVYRWVAPIYSQSKIGMRDCRKILPRKPYAESRGAGKETGVPHIWLPNQDTIIEFWHGQSPEDIEGEGVHGYVLDECAKMKQQVYDSAHTTTTFTRGPKLCISTPRGKNWFYNKCMDAKERMEWAIRNKKPITHAFMTAPSLDNPKIDRGEVDEGRRTLPDRLFRQYFLAEFVDDGDVFAGWRKCLYHLEDQLDDPMFQFWIWPGFDETEDGKAAVDVVIGADWGKTHDWTVFTAWDFKKRRMVGYCRFRGLDYPSAIKRLIWFSSKFRKLEIIYHDQTGLGEVINDILDQTSLPFEGVTFSSKSKSYMVNNMMMAIQQSEIGFPNWGEMAKELDSFEVTTNEIGTMKYSAPDGMHDDIVCSMILGWSAVLEYAEQSLDVRIVGDLPAREDRYSSWLRQAEEDLEDGGYGWVPIKGIK